MKSREGVRLALLQIRTQKLKSFFAVVGVIIGVMFLITVVSVVEGMNRYIEEDFATAVFGVNTITVSRTPEVQMNPDAETRRAWWRRPRLRFEDAAVVERGLTVPSTVGVLSSSGGSLVGEDGTEVENVNFVAASAEVFRIRDLSIERGRAFTAPEDRTGQPVVVLGWEAADKLFGALDPIGRSVKVGGLPFRVIGVMEKRGSLFGMSLDNNAVAPARSAMSRLVNPHGVIDQILVRTFDENDLGRAMTDIEAALRVRHRLRPTEINDFAVETAEGSLEFWNRISRILLVAFPGLVAIALVVGGIVIMNIMLVSVTERTREIGVRKAIGARRRDIHFQVMVESALLSGAGASIGIGIGIGLAQIVRAVSPLPAAIAPFWMFTSVAMGVGLTTALVSTLLPAA